MKNKIKPPFTLETSKTKVQTVEDAWNSRNPERVALEYTIDSKWRNRDEFFYGREEIKEFLKRKWKKELVYRLMKELWAYTGNRISVRFEYEWKNEETGQWWRTYGNEHCEFDEEGLIKIMDISANDIPILECQRKYKI
jgi:nuclear transport factor 2 (NTF2) superfamily protein